MPADPIYPVGNQGPGPPNIGDAKASKIVGGLASPQRGPVEGPAKANSPQTNGLQLEEPNSGSQQKVVQEKAKVTPLALEDAAKTFREFLKNLPSDLQFRADRDSGRVIFKIINPVTREVIRQYPPEEILLMARRLRSSASIEDPSGLFLDQRL